MEAVVLAGGQGRRLLPHTAEIPKPLVPIGGRPIIEILLGRLKLAGVTRVYLATNHMAEMIEEAIGDGSRFGLEVVYSQEPTPLSTVAPLKLISSLPENFIVANGDVLSDIDLRTLYDFHCAHEASVTVATYRRSEKIDFGVIKADASGTITSFAEKPGYDFVVSMGIYVFSRSVLDLVPENQPYGFDDLMIDLLRRDMAPQSFPFDGYWLDVGRLADYEQAEKDVERISRL